MFGGRETSRGQMKEADRKQVVVPGQQVPTLYVRPRLNELVALIHNPSPPTPTAPASNVQLNHAARGERQTNHFSRRGSQQWPPGWWHADNQGSLMSMARREKEREREPRTCSGQNARATCDSSCCCHGHYSIPIEARVIILLLVAGLSAGGVGRAAAAAAD